MSHVPRCPIATLVYNGNLIVATAQKHPAVGARLPANYVADTATILGKLPTDVSGQKLAKGESGNLTLAQQANLDKLLASVRQAQKTAKLAFPGQTVKLHQEFQIGAHAQNDLAAVLTRADIILAAVTANLAALQAKGWTAAETTAFSTVRGTFPASASTQQLTLGNAKDATTLKNTDAATLYERLLTIQNAADLEYPASLAANAGVRDDFRLGTFPPDHHHPPTPAPPPPTTPPK
jgi:hypothetical protein